VYVCVLVHVYACAYVRACVHVRACVRVCMCAVGVPAAVHRRERALIVCVCVHACVLVLLMINLESKLGVCMCVCALVCVRARECVQAKLVEVKLHNTESELKALERKNDDLQTRVLVLQDASLQLQRSYVASHESHAAAQDAHMLSDLPAGKSPAWKNAFHCVNFQEEVDKLARAEMEAKDAEAAAMRAQISLLQAALKDLNLELADALDMPDRKLASRTSPSSLPSSSGSAGAPQRTAAEISARAGFSAKNCGAGMSLRGFLSVYVEICIRVLI